MNKNFEDILCILNEITSFLTITDIYSLSITSKEINNSIFNSPVICNYIFDRDFKTAKKFYDKRHNIHSMFSFFLAIDFGIICERCYTLVKNCDKKICPIRNKISKTECIKYYELKDKDLEKFPFDEKYISIYKKTGIFYDHYDIRKYTFMKYGGLTSFNLIKKIKNEKRKLRQLKMLKKKEDNLAIFNDWKNTYINSFIYNNLTSEQRQMLLDNQLETYDIKLSVFKNHLLYWEFINYNRYDIKNMCVEHIAAIMKMINIMYDYEDAEYGDYLYYEFIDDFYIQIEKMMFKKRKKKFYTWIKAVDDLYSKIYRNKFVNEIRWF